MQKVPAANYRHVEVQQNYIRQGVRIVFVFKEKIQGIACKCETGNLFKKVVLLDYDLSNTLVDRIVFNDTNREHDCKSRINCRNNINYICHL